MIRSRIAARLSKYLKFAYAGTQVGSPSHTLWMVASMLRAWLKTLGSIAVFFLLLGKGRKNTPLPTVEFDS